MQKVAEDDEQHQRRVRDFQTWLVSKTEEVSRFTEIEDVSENRLQALQVRYSNPCKQEAGVH